MPWLRVTELVFTSAKCPSYFENSKWKSILKESVNKGASLSWRFNIILWSYKSPLVLLLRLVANCNLLVWCYLTAAINCINLKVVHPYLACWYTWHPIHYSYPLFLYFCRRILSPLKSGLNYTPLNHRNRAGVSFFFFQKNKRKLNLLHRITSSSYSTECRWSNVEAPLYDSRERFYF